MNLSKNTESTRTENNNFFNVEGLERFLQKRWNEAEKDPEATKLGEPPSQLFTNK